MKVLLPILLFLIATPAHSHESELTYDRISLSASAQQQVNNDTIIVTLYAEEEGSNAAKLADIVNRKIRRAVDNLKRHDDIKLQTNAYTTNPRYNKNKVIGWRVRQSIRLESKNMAKVSQLLGSLQQELALQGMHFAVSPELKTSTNDALIAEALDAFKKRAGMITEELGRRGYRIVSINISTSGGGRMKHFPRAAMMMEADVAAPAVEAGEATVQVNVNATIELE